jgi:hypothetical protein
MSRIGTELHIPKVSLMPGNLGGVLFSLIALTNSVVMRSCLRRQSLRIGPTHHDGRAEQAI